MKYLFCFFLFISVSSALTIEGKVLRVIDGDTIVVNTASEGTIKVRFSYINCPELSTAKGQKVKAYVQKMILGKTVSLKSAVLRKGTYGRYIFEVYYKGKNLNRHLMKINYAKYWYR